MAARAINLAKVEMNGFPTSAPHGDHMTVCTASRAAEFAPAGVGCGGVFCFFLKKNVRYSSGAAYGSSEELAGHKKLSRNKL